MCRIAAEVKKLGVTGIEGFGLEELLPEDANLGERLKESGVAFVGAYYGASLVQPEKLELELREFENTVRGISRLGGRVVAVGGGRVFRGKEQQNWRLLIENAHRMGRIARRHGVQLGFHPHDGTMVFREQELGRFVAETDPSLVGLTFDTAHIAEGGMEICEQLKKHHARVTHVHLKDISGNDFVELGKGSLPLEGFLRELLGRGYSGWLTVELDATLDPVESAQLNLAHLNGLLAKIGFSPRSN